MNRIWQQLAIATNWPVLAAVIVLLSLGTLSIWADTRMDASPEWPRHLIFLVVGVLCMAAFQAIDYRVIGRYSWAIYILALLLILYTIIGKRITVPGVHEVNGASNWIRVGPLSLQPAELMKVGFVMVLARYLRFRSNYRTLIGLLAPFALALVPIAFILKQPDLGTALIFVPALFAMLFVAGAKLRHLFAIIGLGLIMIPLVWFSGLDGVPVFEHLPQLIQPYQRKRVYAMFSQDPETLQKTGFQQERALIAMGSGGIAGRGAGQLVIGPQVPEAHNDMIFALIGEQFGFFGSAVVLGAYIVLFAAGIEISAATKEPFGKLLAIGVVSLLAGQTFLNLMVTTRLLPVTGITLPFVSYGGSSLLASFMAVGLLLNIGQNRPLVMAREAFEFD
jgi:cell division protein FtsW (lipid II flippase)